MRKLIVLTLVLVCILSFSSCSGNRNSRTVSFHDKTFNKTDLSEDTLEWLEWYNELSETEQLAISYIPSDLRELCGYGNAEAAVAETE